MKDKKSIIIGMLLLIVIAFSFLMFFGADASSKTSIQICGFIFTLITELLLFANIYFVSTKEKDTFTVAGLMSLTGVYTIISLIINIILNGLFKSLRGIIVLDIALLLIYLFIALVVFIFKKENA